MTPPTPPMDAARPVVPERLETILLARLSLPAKRPSTAVELAKLTRRFAPTTQTDPAWRELVEVTLAQLQARQLVGADRRLVHQDELQARVGSHTATKWEEWTESLLPALALGMRVDDSKARRRLSATDGWVSAIAARVLGLWDSGPPPPLKSLGDALVWRELRLPGASQACPPALRAHFLERYIALKDGTPSQLVRQIASRAVKAPNAVVGTVRDALVRTWLVGGALGEPASPAVAAPAGAPAREPSLIDAARGAAQATQDRRGR
jgi:hypothetical protein